MEESQVIDRTGEPVTQDEAEQAEHALREWARSRGVPGTLRVPLEQFDAILPLFVLGWASAVRTGHTAPAVAGVPVDQESVRRAFRRLRSGRVGVRQSEGPTLWQQVDYHGSVRRCHGTYWVCAIHTYADPYGGVPELRYDLCEEVDVLGGCARAGGGVGASFELDAIARSPHPGLSVLVRGGFTHPCNTLLLDLCGGR